MHISKHGQHAVKTCPSPGAIAGSAQLENVLNNADSDVQKKCTPESEPMISGTPCSEQHSSPGVQLLSHTP